MAASVPERRLFVIMAFGRDDTDKVWAEVYEQAAGFKAIRIDQTDNGKPKLDQIVNEISTADVIVADLTYERPNCYFELGYAQARRRHEEIILCARRDHIDHSDYQPRRGFISDWPRSLSYVWKPRHAPPRVHFDVAGYDVMPWDLGKLDDFRGRLDGRLRERLALLKAPIPVPEAKPDEQSQAPTVAMTSIDGILDSFRRQLETK